jgi:hypothetical protein
MPSVQLLGVCEALSLVVPRGAQRPRDLLVHVYQPIGFDPNGEYYSEIDATTALAARARASARAHQAS